MIRSVLLIGVIMSIGTKCFTQEIVSKKGEVYLPEAGDWALGIDATPFLQYVGNFFNKDANGSPKFNFTEGGTMIYGKWFKSADMALRGRLKFLGIGNDKDIAYVSDDLSSDPFAQVSDAKTHSQFEAGIAFGIERRKGKTRLQGFYGAEIYVGYGSSKDKFSYGNAITVTNQMPTSTQFNVPSGPPATRTAEINYGSYYYGGVRPFIGVEYFILPKISLGGEFGINIGATGNQADVIKSEYFSVTSAATETATTKLNQNDNFTFIVDNNNLNGAIKILFHF